MLNTNTIAFKAKVFSYLCGAIYDFEGNEEQCARRLREKFESEYNYPESKKRTPNTQERIAEWLAGLPINIACYYSDIIATAELWHECKLNEKQRNRVCERWFTFLAFKMLQLWDKYGLEYHK